MRHYFPKAQDLFVHSQDLEYELWLRGSAYVLQWPLESLGDVKGSLKSRLPHWKSSNSLSPPETSQFLNWFRAKITDRLHNAFPLSTLKLPVLNSPIKAFEGPLWNPVNIRGFYAISSNCRADVLGGPFLMRERAFNLFGGWPIWVRNAGQPYQPHQLMPSECEMP